eukprot:scaffold26.g3321.t1
MAAVRRQTAPAVGSGLFEHLTTTAARLAELRQELRQARRQQKQQAGATASPQAVASAGAALVCAAADPDGPPEQHASDGLSIERLEAMLSTCLQLQENTVRACTGQLCRQESMGDQAEVSLADDRGAGVGAVAAAAVSVALAQSWAAAAGKAEDCLRPGKARFKLVAAVPRSMRRRSPPVDVSRSVGRPTARAVLQRAALTAPAGERHGDPGILGSLPQPLASHSNLQPVGSQASLAASDSSTTLDALAEAGPGVLDESQEAAWRAQGSHLKLQWLSPPSTVLVVHKPVPAVTPACVDAICWLLRRGMAVYVEPAQRASLAPKVAEALERKPPGVGNGDGSNGHGSDLNRDAPIDPLGRLLSWAPQSCSECPEVIPRRVAQQLDLCITLGGDGTVLWTCSLFGSGPVPPIVPFAMGSLGFMTPFPIDCMDAVLGRVAAVGHGFPLMLRHRLQCRILRAGRDASNQDLTQEMPPSCEEEHLVLNEVVIDRGPGASLTYLQCYADQNHVTVVQGDGLIVATPTGSTAYNLAAGGSMIHPGVPGILFTPICAHTLSSRPMVLPEHVTLRVKARFDSLRPYVHLVPPDSRGEAYCSFDGKNRQALHRGDSVQLHSSKWPVPMVCSLDASHDWFLAVREGLHWNVRLAQAGQGS